MAYNPKTGKGLGRFYSAEHRAFRAREWRGFRDTFYDFFRWLYLYGFMAAKLGCHPILMVKAMLRYRWMVSYLTASHMVDRHTMGLRGKELRYAHNQFFSVLHNSVIGVRDIMHPEFGDPVEICAPTASARQSCVRTPSCSTRWPRT